MSAPSHSGGAPVTDKRQLVEYLAAGCKPRAEWRIGTEHEKFIFRRADLHPVPYEGDNGIRAILEKMRRFGWHPVLDGENIVGLTDDSGGAISLEPGGQFELSGAPLETLHQTCSELHTHLKQMREVTGELGLGMLGLGFLPKWKREDCFWMPKRRYAVMRNYMPKKGKLGIDMMLRTCTVQVNLDFADEADMVLKSRVSLALQPIAIALFANSPFVEGKPSGFLSRAAMSGPIPIPIAPACCLSSSRTVSASSAMSIGCSMCRCISSIATAITSMSPDKASATSSPAGCRGCRAKFRPSAIGRII